MPDQKKPDALDQQETRTAAPAGPVYEVLVDTWGYIPQFVKGDLVSVDDAPEYDFGWAETMGVIRRVEGAVLARGIASTTQPLTSDGEIDEAAQAKARAGAGLPPQEPPREPGEPPKKPQA